jgi:hypothetical protein
LIKRLKPERLNPCPTTFPATRAQALPFRLLGGYRGFVTTDGCAGYNALKPVGVGRKAWLFSDTP